MIPWAAACSHSCLKNWFPAAPKPSSQSPKLSLITGARLLFTMYTAERSTPSVVSVDSETTRLIFAFLATAPDHSTSISASASSYALGIPGSVPSRVTCGSLGGRPKRLRKSRTSWSLILDRPTMAIFSPLPSVPAFQSGRTLYIVAKS